MAYYGAMAKDASGPEKLPFKTKTSNHRHARSALPRAVPLPPEAVHYPLVPQLLEHFRVNTGHLVLIIERESKVNGAETAFISTRFTMGVLGRRPKTLHSPKEFIPTVAYVPLEGEHLSLHEGPYVLRHPLDRINNRVHVGPVSKKLLELVVGAEAVMAYDAAELSHREWRSRTAAAKRLLGIGEKRPTL